MRSKIGMFSLFVFIMLALMICLGCDKDKVKLADGTIISLSDLPPDFDTSSLSEATIEDIIEDSIKTAKPGIDLLPYGSTATASALILLGMWRKLKPQTKALREVFEGIEDSNGESAPVLKSLSKKMSPKSKKLIDNLRLKDQIAKLKAGNGKSHS